MWVVGGSRGGSRERSQGVTRARRGARGHREWGGRGNFGMNFGLGMDRSRKPMMTRVLVDPEKPMMTRVWF